MKINESDVKYLNAKTRVEKLRGFYSHLSVYLVINLIITGVKLSNNLDSWNNFKSELIEFSTLSSWLVWGIILAIHAFSVFGFIRGWEERKIKELIDKELSKDTKK